MEFKAFNVFLNGKNIDTLFYLKNEKITADEIRQSLINHDGYDPGIVVRRAYKKTTKISLDIHPK